MYPNGVRTTTMDMNRRNVLLGLGTAAAGSGAVFGSGAFSQVQADRDILIEIDSDADSLVGISDESDTSLVDTSGDNLSIDSDSIANTSGTGFPSDSIVLIGPNTSQLTDTDTFDTSSSPNDAAFSLTSGFADSTSSTLDVEVVTAATGTFNSYELVVVQGTDPQITAAEDILDLTSGSAAKTGIGFTQTDDPVYAAIQLDVPAGSTGDGIGDVTLRFTVNSG